MFRILVVMRILLILLLLSIPAVGADNEKADNENAGEEKASTSEAGASDKHGRPRNGKERKEAVDKQKVGQAYLNSLRKLSDVFNSIGEAKLKEYEEGKGKFEDDPLFKRFLTDERETIKWIFDETTRDFMEHPKIKALIRNIQTAREILEGRLEVEAVRILLSQDNERLGIAMKALSNKITRGQRLTPKLAYELKYLKIWGDQLIDTAKVATDRATGLAMAISVRLRFHIWFGDVLEKRGGFHEGTPIF